MRILLKSIIASTFLVFILLMNSCDEPTTVVTVTTEPITLTINHFFKNEVLVFNKIYQGPQGRDLWITKKKYYLSNITAVSSEGKNYLIKDIALVELGDGSDEVTISGEIPKGNYNAISFDLGVREDLNLKDPATYDINHPLSVTHNMYWGWSTQYIFSKFEGYEILNDDTTSFVIHTGTQSLYRPEITVARNFEISSTKSEVSIDLDIFSILATYEYTFDLTDDGQSHTTDNLPLAVYYMDNFTVAFD